VEQGVEEIVHAAAGGALLGLHGADLGYANGEIREKKFQKMVRVSAVASRESRSIA
jgi:hypothetical protein